MSAFATVLALTADRISPDAQFMAFLSFNETGVGTFTIPYYMNDSTIAPPYPRELELRYPKVGTTNPTVMRVIGKNRIPTLCMSG